MRRVGSWASGMLVGVLCAGAGAADLATVTAVEGEARVDGADARALGLRSSVGSEPITTPEGGKLSLLLETEAVVDVCGNSGIALRTDEEAGAQTQVVELQRGDLRAYVAPRAGDERFEIHTPAALAVIVGTIVRVSHDADTGKTSVVSEDNPLRVRSASPGVGGEVTICCGEEATVSAGERPRKTRKLGAASLARLNECFAGLREAAAAADRVRAERERLDELARTDTPAELPPVASPPPGTPELPTGPVDVCYATGCDDDVRPPEPPKPSGSAAGSGPTGGP